MGGKQKQSQRTKNNVRPSSSGRSAELLGGAVSSFVGFSRSDSKQLPVTFPLIADSPEEELSPEFLLVIKKLNKKDPITKTKALQELAELVTASSVEEVTAILGYWARLYGVLTTDTEHKVREAAQVTHGTIVAKCGRAMAPYLKQIIPAWLTSQYDNYAPAASSAQDSLQAAFPESKLPEVIEFCKSKMMAHISNNLIGNTQSVQNKVLPPEIQELKYQRTIIASLQGLDFFTKHLPEKQSEWLWAEQSSILESDKFWKLSSNKATQIRSAWFGAIARQIERFKNQFCDVYGAKTTNILVDNLAEKDPIIAMQLWDCLLFLVASIENWYNWVEKKQDLSKRILEVLENGGWGNATHLSGMLLPLLAHLPAEMLTKEFYCNFFTALLSGLDKKAIMSSTSQRQAWITSIAECVRYLSIHQIEDYACEIVTSAHRTWLEKILSTSYETQTSKNLIKHSATNMASLVKYWLKQSKESKQSDKYDQLVRNFWQNICSTLLAQLEKQNENTIEKCIEGHIGLILTIKSAFHEPKKRVSIRFESDKEREEIPRLQSENTDSSLRERYMHNLNDLVYKICSEYLQHASKFSTTVLTPLYTLLLMFDSREMFVSIANDFGTNAGKDSSMFGFYDSLLKDLLIGDTGRSKAVMDIVFLLLPHLTEEEQRRVFDSFKLLSPSVVEICISKCLSHPYSSQRSVCEWLKSEQVESCLAAICKRLVEEGDSLARNLLLMSFSQDRNGEILISESACSTILSILAEGVSNTESPHLDVCASVASQIATILITEDKSPSYKQLLLEMFRLNALTEPTDNFTDDTWWEVKTSWQDAASTLEDEDRKWFVERTIEIIHHCLLKEDEEIDLKVIQQVVELAPSLLTKFNEYTAPKDGLDEIVYATNELFKFKDYKEVPNNVEMFALKYDCLTGNINCPFSNGSKISEELISHSHKAVVEELKHEAVVKFVKICLFKAMYLKTILNGPKKVQRNVPDDDDEDEQEKVDWAPVILADETVEREFAGLLHDYVILQSLYKGYAFWKHYSVIHDSRNKLNHIMAEIQTKVSMENATKFYAILSDSAAENGFYWSYAKEYYRKQLSDSCTQAQAENALAEYMSAASRPVEKVVSGDGFFHSIQASLEDSYDKELIYKSKYRLMLRSFYVAYVDDPKIIDADFRKCCLQDDCNLDLIVNKYYEHNDTMLYDKDIVNEDWCKVVCNAAVVDALSSRVRQCGWEMPSQHWDFTTITLSSLLHSLEKSKHSWGCTKMGVLARSLFELYIDVEYFISNVKAECLKRQPSEHVANLPTEWSDIFAPDLHEHLFGIAIHILETSIDRDFGCSDIVFLDGFIRVAQKMNWDLLSEHHKAGALSLDRVVASCLKVLESPCSHVLKYLSYYVLKMMTKPLVLEDANKLVAWSETETESEEETERPKFSLSRYHAILHKLQEIIEVVVSHVKLVEETCELMPFTDSYSMALSYLLLYEALFGACNIAHSDLQQQYIEFFRHDKLIAQLMANCLQLMPSEVIKRALDTNTSVTTGVPQHLIDLFTDTPNFVASEVPRGRHVSRLACRCVMLALGGVGAPAARSWWGALSGRSSRTVDRIVSANITPTLVRAQLAPALAEQPNIANTQITVHWSVNELLCHFLYDDRKLELKVELGSNYPLALPRIESSLAVANHTQWLSMYLSYQNGSVAQVLHMWTAMVARRVGNSPVCYICYSRLHTRTGKLPKMNCWQCKNTYHTTCLFKWFQSSTKSTCPICRNNF